MKRALFNLVIKDTQLYTEEKTNAENVAKYSLEVEPISSDNGNGEDLVSIYTKGHIRPVVIGKWTITPSIQVWYDWGSYRYKVILVDCNKNEVVLNGKTSFGTQSSMNFAKNVLNAILGDVSKVLNCSNKEEWIMQIRSTSNNVYTLRKNEIFVFGSDSDGNHLRGAALQAFNNFGALQGQGVGLQGSSYAIPTLFSQVEEIKPYVDSFIEYAKQHPDSKFLVTKIGCGLAGFSPSLIAPLFVKAQGVENIYLPKQFWEVLFCK